MLKTLIIELCGFANGQPPAAGALRKIDAILEENDLAPDSKVPGWLLRLVESLTTGKEVPKTLLHYSETDGDAGNFLAELEELVDAKWNDYGEAIEITFTKLKLQVFISREDQFFQVSKL